MLAINEQIKAQLDLRVLDSQLAELADGQRVKVDVVGPIEVRFKNRRATVDAMVLPGEAEVLLGAIPMEDMDLIVDPKRRELIVNPEHPFFAEKPLK